MNRKYLGIVLATAGLIAVFHELVTGSMDLAFIGGGVVLLGVGYGLIRAPAA